MRNTTYRIPQTRPFRHFFRSFVLLLTLLAANVASAQELTLRSFKLVENDLSAMTNERRDLNDKRCALVKVQLPIKDCVFVGAKVGEVEFKVNEYWLYVPENTKMIYIQCPGLESSLIVWETRIGDCGVRSGCTYMMRLDGYATALTLPAATSVHDGNYLVMDLTPADASVKIDGKQQASPKDGKLSVYLSSGNHSYEVSALGYSTEAGVISMGTDQQSLDVSLISVMAHLTLSCETPGVTFYVNDERVGGDGWSGELAAGVYYVEARKDGYRTLYHDVTLAEKGSESVSFPELVAVFGALDVNYEPIYSEVWLDGVQLGVSPGVWDVAAGSHTVELCSSGYTSEKLSVSVSEGQTVSLTGSLSRGKSTSAADGKINGYEYVDLGLSVKWATCNVGAITPTDYGDYYAWGETNTKGQYTEGNSLTSGSIIDNIGGNSSYDVACANWGDSWRLPTRAEFKDLLDNCNSEWTTVKKIKGLKLTSKKNGKSIFLPAAGWFGASPYFMGQEGFYWSATPYGTDDATILSFDTGDCSTYTSCRYYGYSVRPVVAE